MASPRDPASEPSLPDGRAERAGPGRELPEGVSVRPGRDGALDVESPFPFPGWRERRPATARSPTHPGTAVDWRGRWFEVVEIGARDGGPWTIRLRPWDDALTMRRTAELTEETVRAAARAAAEEARRERSARILWWAAPLLGLLPAPKQRRLEAELGLRAERATALSGAVLLGLAMTGLVTGWAWKAGIPFSSSTETLGRWCYRGAPLLVYLVAESLARAYCGFSGLAVGSLLGWPFGVLVRGGDPGLPTRAPGRAAARPAGRVRIDPDRDRDEVRRPVGPGADLEVVSLLPKEHWRPDGSTGIRVGEDVYLLEGTTTAVGSDGRPRHVFRLRRAPEDAFFRSWAEHRPEEVGELWRAAGRRRAATFVESWAHVWGLLDEPTQLALGRGYDYDPWRRTAVAIAVEGVVGGLHLLLGAGRILEDGSAGGALVFSAGAVMTWEALLRWARYRQGTIHPSLLAPLLAPLVREAVAYAPPPVAVAAVPEAESLNRRRPDSRSPR